MPEQAHSPEPWSVGTTDIGGEKYNTLFSGGNELMLSQSAGYGGETVIDISEDDLRRIVACVNFCREFPTEILEQRRMLYATKENWGTLADIPGFEGLVPCYAVQKTP